MSSNVLALTNQEIEQCRTAFQQFDRDSSGTIDSNELKETLEAMGQHPTDEEVFSMLNLIDDNGSGTCDFSEFVKVILDQKLQQLDVDGELDTIAAFVAMGGNEDKSGVITSEKLSKTIKVPHFFPFVLLFVNFRWNLVPKPKVHTRRTRIVRSTTCGTFQSFRPLAGRFNLFANLVTKNSIETSCWLVS
jgi:calmodulin